MKVLYPTPPAGAPPMLDFIETLDSKLRRKLLTQLVLLSSIPGLGEPHVKHFTISKYSNLYELCTRCKVMVRIIFTTREDKSILLLEPFIKKHKRNTMQALESSLKLLRQVESGYCSVRELDIKTEMERKI